MAAALVRLYFDADGGEGLALLALEALTRRHLAGLLARDPAAHTAALHEQLGGLQRLLAGVDPPLCMGLRDMGISPDMYAVRTHARRGRHAHRRGCSSGEGCMLTEVGQTAAARACCCCCRHASSRSRGSSALQQQRETARRPAHAPAGLGTAAASRSVAASQRQHPVAP